MKILNKIIIVFLVIVVSSCSTDLDLLDSPNEVSPENANIEDLFNKIQLDFEDHFNEMWFNTAGMARMTAHGGAYDYLSATNPNDLNDLWSNIYSEIFPDIAAVEAIATERGQNYHLGAVNVLKAILMTHLVDLFGDVPYSQAGLGSENFSPAADPGSEIYAEADRLLDQAITYFNEGGPAPTNDLFYGGSSDKWIKLANTYKLRNALTTRLANGSAGQTIKSLVDGGQIITSANDDFEFKYGTQRQTPNSRHPLYVNMYESADGSYMSNYYMWLLRAEKEDAEGNAISDPRIRYYFYRKTNDAVNQNVNVYACHFSDLPDQTEKPDHYNAIDSRIPYCVAAADGYFGRDHLNNEGIPPDGPIRTAFGLYPMGGQFDDNSYSETQLEGTTGARGEGIQPIMLSFFVDFMRAEAALTAGTGEDARELLKSGIEGSIAKAMSFASKVSSTMGRQITDPVSGDVRTVEELYVPSQESIDSYVNFVLDSFDAADDDGKLDIVAKEYYIALWGNGLEAYNLYRRTGKPGNMAPSLEPNPGPFIRSFFLPNFHVNRNASASQKELTVPVFWDTNPDGFVY